MTTNVPAELERRMDEAIGHYPAEHRRSASMPLLHLWQEHFGFISDEGVNWIAAKLGLEPINILELVTFYPMFRQAPAGRKHIRVCRTLSCAMAGAYPLMENLARLTKIDREHQGAGTHEPFSVSSDGEYSIEFVECLASCGTAPVCMVDDELLENVEPNRAPEILTAHDSRFTLHPPPPHPLERRLIFQNIGREGYTIDIDCYLRHGGYEQLKAAIKMSRAEIVNEVKTSGLRGRGGAGFPCGVKWSFIKPDEPKPIYLICNADESEPGTFKDRYIIHQDPHQLIEGMLISCWALNVHTAYIYIRGEFPEGARILEHAIDEARAKNFLGKNILGTGFDVEILRPSRRRRLHLRRGDRPDRIARGQARLSAHQAAVFPRRARSLQCPTIVNNVETLCHVKHIIAMGGAEYARIGRPNNTGTRIVCVSGDVVRPGYYEIEVGVITMGQLINEMAGGAKPGRKIKAVIPGGSSAKVLRAGDRYQVKDGRGVVRGHPDGFRFAGRGRLDGRLRRRDRAGRLARHGLGAEQHQRILRARELRPVHALPRRLALDEENHPAHAGRRRRRPRTRRRSRTWPTTSPAAPFAPSARPAPGRPRASSRSSPKILPSAPRNRSRRRCRPNIPRRN